MNNEIINIDVEDVEYVLLKAETSFNIEFADCELSHVSTFGELYDSIAAKIQLAHSDNCTSLQAFYKFREAVSETLPIDKSSISPDTRLTDFLPRGDRRKRVKEIERYLGFKLNILYPKSWLLVILFIIFSGSFIGLFFHWQTGLLGLLLSMGGIGLANKTGNELNLKTAGDVAGKMTREHYLKSRRDSNTINRKEVENVLKDLFCSELSLSKEQLTRETKLIK